MCATRPKNEKNENESKNEKHGDKSECVYDNVKIKIESAKVVNTRLVCSGQVRGCCSAYMSNVHGSHYSTPLVKKKRKPVERTKMKVR